MPRILVTNDDGIYSEGLAKLAEAVRPLGDVVIVAPDREQSAASHALTLNRPLRLQEIGPDRWIVDGTPTDCVNLALLHIFRDQRPDLVVSGINFGPNMGDDVTYSGTISAAFEGSLLNVPSIAFSAFIGEHFDFTPCAAFAAELLSESSAIAVPWTFMSESSPKTSPRRTYSRVTVTLTSLAFPIEPTDKNVHRT